MGLLYYIPARRFEHGAVPESVKSRRVTPEAAVCLEDLGLAHLDGGITAYRGVRTAGPDGGAGLVLGFRVPANETGFFKDAQEWRPVLGGDLYLGWATGSQPGPDAFLREDALAAEMEVRMGDGNVWGFVPTRALPETYGYGPDGELTTRPRAKDAAHFAASEWLMQFLQSGEPRPYIDTLERVAVCLGARYHVSLVEVLALELFSTDLFQAVVFACLGIEEKKTGAGS
jgi:hypothetical protein